MFLVDSIAMSDSSATNASLILRVRNGKFDDAAWREFVERYGSRIYRWCLQRQLQSHDAEDVAQEVVLRLARRFREFDYDPSQSFRGWLRRVTENAIVDFRRARHGRLARASSIDALLDEATAPTELTDHLAEAFDLELFEWAKANVRSRILLARWLSWELTAIECQPASQVAERLGIPTATVYANKNQVQKMIREEVTRLEQGSHDNQKS